jgi:hypothetical protein
MIPQEAEFQWCVSLSRPSLNPKDMARINGLSKSIANWPALAQKAQEQLIAPLIYHHLHQWPEQPWLGRAKEAFRSVALSMTMKALQHARLQKEFVENHLGPLNIDFAIVKGKPLAERYYPHPHTRISRDIDVWMHAKDMVKVVQSAQASGFVTYPHQRALRPTELAIHFRNQQGIILYDRRGILVELDQRLDKSQQFFSIEKELSLCEYQTIDDVAVKVLPTTELFIYICLHHTRHRWSKLIWLSDIEAVQSASDFDREALETKARAKGVWQTVEATLLFAAACRKVDPWAAASKDGRVSDMLKDCHAMFTGGRAREIESYQTRLSPDFPYAWQFNGNQAKRDNWRKHVNKFRPTLNDYHMVRLPLSLYPLYYLLRPFLALVRKVQRALKVPNAANDHPAHSTAALPTEPSPPRERP